MALPGGFELLPEPPGHPGPKVRAVPQPVVLEGHVRVVREQVQVPTGQGGGLLDLFAAAARVPLVPDAGREGVGVAEQHRRARPGRPFLLRVLAPCDDRELRRGEGDVRPGGRRIRRAGGRQLLLAVPAPVLGDPARTGPDPAAPPVVGGERPRERGGAGGLGPEDDHTPGQCGPHGRSQEVPAADGVRPYGGSGHREQGPRGVHADLLGAEPPGELGSVLLRGEDGVHRPADRGPEDRHVRLPDGRVAQVDGDVVDRPDDLRLRVRLAHPRDPVGERDRFHRGRADQYGQPLAPVLGGAHQVVVAGVRRVELAQHQAVSEAPHAGTSFSVRVPSAGSVRRQPARPATHRARKPT